MRSLARIALVIGLGLGWGLGLGANADAQPRRGPGAVNPPGPERREQIEQLKKRIRAMRAYRLTEALALDQQTAGRLFPVLARFDEETDKLLDKRGEIQRRLRRANEMRDPRAIDRLIDDAVGVQRSLWDLEDRRVAELRKILTPAQTAKLLVVLPALERRIQNQIQKAIAQRTGTVEPADDDVEPDEVPPPRPRRPRREGPLAPGGPSNAPGNTPPCDPRAGPCR